MTAYVSMCLPYHRVCSDYYRRKLHLFASVGLKVDISANNKFCSWQCCLEFYLYEIGP